MQGAQQEQQLSVIYLLLQRESEREKQHHVRGQITGHAIGVRAQEEVPVLNSIQVENGAAMDSRQSFGKGTSDAVEDPEQRQDQQDHDSLC